MYAKLIKCEFWLKQVVFLGHIISKNELAVDPGKIEAVVNWERKKNVSEIRTFLRLAGYYRRFVKSFSTISVPLTKLTTKDVLFKWSNACNDSFQELKERLTTTPILSLPSGNGGLVVFTDSSGIGLGCVLM